ncbi:MFS general substrate transporter [Abortiporus biennis]|nr:MFS general substrate transporter [Abortiporus biennis]
MEEDRKSSTNEKEKDQVELKESATVDNVKQVGVDDYPDGGLRAWLVVFGAASGTFATFGYVNAWGVFQAYYEQNTLSNTDPSTIAWIGSIEYALIFIPGLLSGRLFDMGHFKVMLLVSSAIVVTATFLIAQCKEYWQFLLCQGFAVGLACGCIFGPMLGVVAHWFKYKRGVALGVVAIGSSIGGTIFPIAARKLIPLVGFQWTMRILGFIQLAALGVTNLTLERRLPPKTVVGPFINLTAFRNKAYTMYCFSSLVAFLGLYTVLTYIDISASAAGVSDDFSFYLVSIANASSGLGRIAGGFLADSSGSLNVLAPATFIAAILTYAWPFAKSQGAFVAIAVIYGIASGVYVSLLPAPVMQMGQTHDVGVRVGMLMTVLAFGAVAGPPISGAINTATGGFDAVGYYAGSTVIVAVIMMVSTKYLHLGTLRGKF